MACAAAMSAGVGPFSSFFPASACAADSVEGGVPARCASAACIRFSTIARQGSSPLAAARSARQSSIAALNCPSCSLAMASRMRGSISVASRASRLLERLARFRRHQAVIREHERLALAGEKLGRGTEQPDRPRVCFGRFGVAAPSEIDGRDHLPPLSLFGILPEARLDLCDERFDVLVARRIFEARGKGLVGKARRAVGEDRGRATSRGSATPTIRIAALAAAASRLGAIGDHGLFRRRQGAGARSRSARLPPPSRRSSPARDRSRSRRADRDRRRRRRIPRASGFRPGCHRADATGRKERSP